MSEKDKTPDFIEEGPQDAPLLTAKEVAEIKAEAKAALLKKAKQSAREALLEQETLRLRNEEGLVTGNSYKDEIVNITIDLAEFAACLVINSRPYWHGQTYAVPRHVADSLREMMYRSHGHQAEIDGKDRKQFYAQKHVADLYKVAGKGTNLSGKAA